MASLAILLVCCTPASRVERDFGDLLVKLEVGTRAEVEKAILELGKTRYAPAVEGLIRRLKGPDKKLRKLAAAALGRIGNPKALLALYDAGEVGIVLKHRRKARAIFRKLPPSPRRTEMLSYVGNQRELREALEHEKESVRVNAARMLVNLMRKGRVPRVPHPKTIAALTERLRDKVPRVRAAAAHTLGCLRTAAKPALPHLGLRMYDEDPKVRRDAVTAISRIDKGLEALRYIRRGLKDKDKGVREAALAARRRCTLPERCRR